MTITERRNAILNFLCLQRYETLDNLAARFGVSKITIWRDITAMSCNYPIRTVRGRYGGGIYIEEWFHPDRKFLSEEQIEVIQKVLPLLEDKERMIMKSILVQFAPYSERI